MGTEDTSERVTSGEDSRLGREEKQSVQGNIAIKGTRNGLLLTLEPETPFSELLNALSDRLAEAPGFFRGASLALDTSRRMLRMSERTQLEDLLAHYQMSVTPLEQVTPAHKYAEAGTVSSNDTASNTVTMSEILDAISKITIAKMAVIHCARISYWGLPRPFRTGPSSPTNARKGIAKAIGASKGAAEAHWFP